jgi:diguanylate cyclase (GGDEF)-like protein
VKSLAAGAYNDIVFAQGSPSVGLDSALVNPRLLLGVETAVIAALLLLLYIYRRRPYVVWWMWGWVALSAGSLFSAGSFQSEQLNAMAFGVAQFLRIVAGLLFVVATDAYRQAPRLQRSYGLLLLPVAIWFTLSPAALGTVAVYAPGFLLVAGSMASAGIAHVLLARQARLLGASLVGATLLCFAAVNAYLATTSELNTAGLLLPIVVIFLLTALGMQLMTFEDMTFELQRTNRRLEAAQDDLRQAVITDPLTGTRNRRFFEEVIGREMQRHRRYKSPLSIVFIDVDHFKTINDTLGHETGDQVLREVASFLLRHIREADYVFRWGGDEFLVLISCGEQEAQRRARDLQAAFAQSPQIAELPPGVALSIGCVEVPPDADDIMPFVQMADERMYEDKKKRRH